MPPYTGSAFGHPGATQIGEFTGHVSVQSHAFQAAVASMRAGFMSHEPGYAAMPYDVELTMPDGTRVRGRSGINTSSVNSSSGDCQILLSIWNHDQLEWCIIKITGGNITLSVWRNPPEHQSDWRSVNPSIIPPPPLTNEE